MVVARVVCVVVFVVVLVRGISSVCVVASVVVCIPESC